ncbi:MAG TPA: GH92 family glycosyl hydrolase [Bacteroidales bacterium]|jgi:predicted alpha-1,2-mannosidase|nr:GH92 family glycosyl hydrolase [Bacteroidales bacterium]HQH25548.1 GH92 family glycosyl hydrolase [Bacteroidales bacterium]HQJ82660.1 GH92 family glycosyl hydrolase [Bacteroidales bacterium]
MKTARLFTLLLLLSAILYHGCNSEKENNREPVDYVNPYIGNISHLLVPTYPTVHLPNSMLRVYPERADYTTLKLRGLPLVVTSHRGRSAFNLSPFQGEAGNLAPVISYTYDHEKISPYSYSVVLDEQNIGVRMGVSRQSALYEFTFPDDGKKNIILNSGYGEMKWDGKAVSGYQNLNERTKVFIYLEPDVRPSAAGVLKDGRMDESLSEASGRNAAVVLSFPGSTPALKLRYGISFIDADQAKRNLEREIRDFDLGKIQSEGRRIWNEALGKIRVRGGSEDDRTVFYTSVYRIYERPVNITEDGRYFSAFDGKVHDCEGVPFYTDDWIWDTYRAAHPLRVLTEPELETNIIRSFLRMTEQMENPWMPTFPGITGDSRSMNSNHGVASVIDAYRKGLQDFDLEQAYEACRRAIMEKTLAPWSGKPAGRLDDFYKEHGYIPALAENEKETIPEVHPFEKRQAVAVTLGTAYDQWCLAQIAKELGKTDDYRYFLECSYNYRKLFNAETDFFHPKDSRGNFIMPFDYKFSGGMGARDYYDENNAYTYRWDVQHNIADLIKLMGGREKFVKRLDETFNEPLGRSKYAFYAQLPDQTGNVGQFSMANEPSLHIPYLYNYAGQPWRTQKLIRTLLFEWFRNDLMGVPGDEDGGGTSAFVVFSQLGFYPVTPGSPTYNIGSPVFTESVMDLGNGREFKIVALNCSEENKYIQSARLNGREWNKPWFSHDDIKDGATLELVMGPSPERKWGSDADSAPPSAERME